MKLLSRVMIVLVLLAGVAFSQSLGDVARENRQTPKKSAKRVYTNDDIPSANKLRDTSEAEAETAQTGTPEKNGTPEKKDAEKKNGDPDEGTKKKWEETRKNIEAQKKAVGLLEREVDVLTRENQIQIANYYADVGNRFRDPQAWSDQMKKNQGQIDAKTRDLEQAKAKLETIREDGRKAGVPASYLE